MIKHVARSVAVATGTLLSLAVLASPATADVVPSGCVGSVYYACTGDAHPPEVEHFENRQSEPTTIRLWSDPQPLLPGMTVGGQTIGDVIVPVGGEIAPETTINVGGPTSPIDTGITAPISICAFVACFAAGDPVVVPGFDLPLVPVVIPAVTAPSETVEVPVLGTAPEQTTPDITVPAYDVEVATISLYLSESDAFVIADLICRTGGGETVIIVGYPDGTYAYRCEGGLLAPVADQIFWNAV